MSTPVKIVTLTDEQRDLLRELISKQEDAERALRSYKNNLKAVYAPRQSTYAPFHDYPMEIVDDKGDAKISDRGTTHIYFTQRLQS